MANKEELEQQIKEAKRSVKDAKENLNGAEKELKKLETARAKEVSNHWKRLRNMAIFFMEKDLKGEDGGYPGLTECLKQAFIKYSTVSINPDTYDEKKKYTRLANYYSAYCPTLSENEKEPSNTITEPSVLLENDKNFSLFESALIKDSICINASNHGWQGFKRLLAIHFLPTVFFFIDEKGLSYGDALKEAKKVLEETLEVEEKLYELF